MVLLLLKSSEGLAALSKGFTKYEFLLYFLNDSFATKLMVDRHMPESSENVESLWSRSQQMFRILRNVYTDNIFWSAECFVTKHGIVMHLS